jgi:hypothetical protein
VHVVEMTESDHELLKEKIRERRESKSKSAIILIPEHADLPSDDARAETPLDAPTVAAAVSSDFRIDLVEPKFNRT